MIVWPLLEELRPPVMPVLEGADGCSALQHGLRELTVVEADVAQDGLLEVLAGAEAVALQHVLDPAVEALDHAGSSLTWIAARIFGVVVACLCKEISMLASRPESHTGSILP